MRSGRRERRRRGISGGDAHADERWLLTYSDMITLLMALFIILWSVSSVNTSKFKDLATSLHSAFSGRIVPGNTSILSGQTAPFSQAGTPVQQINPGSAAGFSPTDIRGQIATSISNAAARQEAESLRKIQQQIETYAQQHGIAFSIRTKINERGLVIRVLTDQVLFGSGQATLKPAATPLLTEIVHLLDGRRIDNAIRVEGNTDSVPISAGVFRSNWQLSAARADAVLEFLVRHGIGPSRLSLAGYSDQNPIVSNATSAGRAANRRVDLVLLRRSHSTTEGGVTP
ncbi:MAG: flagellar motor protein MotB [Gaiellaceae bacterium]